MIGNPFTYPAWDLLTMTQLDSMPYQAVSFGDAVNQVGAWQGGFILADPRIQAQEWYNATRTGRTLLCVDLGGVLVWGGIIWTRRYSDSDKSLKIGASSVGSYFQQRIQANDYTSTWASGADPMVIARTIVSDAQAVTGGSIAGGIVFVLNPVGGSGQSVVVSYPGTQLSTVEQIVGTLATMGYQFGFDYSFDVSYIPGTKTPQVTMNLWYPRKGRAVAQNNIVIEHKDVLDFNYDEDSTKQANSIFESGGTGVVPIELTTVTPGYPLLEATLSHSDVVTEAVLSNITFNDAGLLVWPVVTPSLTIGVPLPDPTTGVTDPSRLNFGGFVTGDNLIHKIEPQSTNGGLNACPRFPSGMSFEWRMNGWTCTVPDKGIPTIAFDLGVPPVSVLPSPQPPLI